MIDDGSSLYVFYRLSSSFSGVLCNTTLVGNLETIVVFRACI